MEMVWRRCGETTERKAFRACYISSRLISSNGRYDRTVPAPAESVVDAIVGAAVTYELGASLKSSVVAGACDEVSSDLPEVLRDGEGRRERLASRDGIGSGGGWPDSSDTCLDGPAEDKRGTLSQFTGRWNPNV